MLGYYRYILAMLVASSHLWTDIIWWQGIYAVFGFYVISGYLMTLIIKEVYIGTSGAWRYTLNRILRIYPVYWLCLILGLVLLYIIGLFPGSLSEGNILAHRGLYPIEGLSGWFKNITLFGLQDVKLTISQGWSLKVEVIFYILMLALCRRFWIVVLWLLVSIAICIYHEINGVTFANRYGSVEGASLAFSLGSLLYYVRQKYELPKIMKLGALVLFVGHFVFSYRIWGFQFEAVTFYGFLKKTDYGLYAHTVLSALLLWAVLDSETPKTKSIKFSNVGQYLGNLAYAVFLCHWIVAYMVILFGIEYTNKPLFIPATFIGINLLAMIIFHGFEHKLDRNFRDRIRGQNPR